MPKATASLSLVISINLLLWSELILAQTGFPALTVETSQDGEQTYSLSLQILALMTALTLLPAIVLSMTSFVRIIIVLAILRQALGTQQTPSNQVLLGLALFLTLFIMMPVGTKIYEQAISPYLDEQVSLKAAFEISKKPVHRFMVEQTREGDISLFAEIAGVEFISSPANIPFSILMPAFLISELKTAFLIGFIIFIPFVIIDLLVASVLMSMGMVMLSPLVISLPFKIMLFVLVDGWALLSGTLASSYYGVIP